eukprot:CAMPEP_0181354984 /NCGR_PEP_ID=MMETSP1106-20121128/3654_1 /TAXON_ID=81844 /ORGANISM="Mantoniella antarctica, Strain SL-175" /LENGTH=38 /DNA_ID= /DNA_START= /DNA_END= /DNA_ORIENTATION=
MAHPRLRNSSNLRNPRGPRDEGEEDAKAQMPASLELER